QKLAQLAEGAMPIHEPGLSEMVLRNQEEGRLSFTDDYADALQCSSFAFIAVQTPTLPDGNVDTTAVCGCVDSLIHHAPCGLILVLKSTVPVGTAENVRSQMLLEGRSDIEVVSNPEFLSEGTAVEDFFRPTRVVIGAENPDPARAVGDLYSSVEAP